MYFMKKYIVIFVCATLVLSLLFYPKTYNTTFISMTTDVDIKLKSHVGSFFYANKVLKNMKEKILDIDKKANTKTGEVSVKDTKKDNDLRQIYQLSIGAKKDTNGYFDVNYKSKKMDFSGIAKGYAIYKASRLTQNVLINAGGDIVVQGADWKVGLKDPKGDDSILTLNLNDTSVCTSGTYERGDHIINPFTGKKPDNTVLSCTAIYDNTALADAYATGLFASRGKAQDKIIKKLEPKGVGVIIVYSNKTIYISKNIDYTDLKGDYKLCGK